MGRALAILIELLLLLLLLLFLGVAKVVEELLVLWPFLLLPLPLLVLTRTIRLVTSSMLAGARTTHAAWHARLSKDDWMGRGIKD